MEFVETQSSSRYANGPPWFFKGRALYQLHLVKEEIARAFIPKDFRLVEAFGYTLGGFFLAHYDDSPTGIFDEIHIGLHYAQLVVIAGIVWNPPTSCAWAARVLVNSNEACIHGRKDIGLPSHVAGFSKRVIATSEGMRSGHAGFLNMLGIGPAFQNCKDSMEIQVTETKDSTSTNFCNIYLPTAGYLPLKPCYQTRSSSSKTELPGVASCGNLQNREPRRKGCIPEFETKEELNKRWLGPVIKMSLPSFSGRTQHNPKLLKYSCQIECRVRAVETAKVSGANTALIYNEEKSSNDANLDSDDLENGSFDENISLNRSISVLLSKPILALEFNFLKMQVEAPIVVNLPSKRTAVDS